MISFIDDHRQAYGVEPICRVLPVAPSTDHDHASKRRDPSLLSARAKQDEALKVEVRRVFDEHFRVYGVRRSGANYFGKGFPLHVTVPISPSCQSRQTLPTGERAPTQPGEPAPLRSRQSSKATAFGSS